MSLSRKRVVLLVVALMIALGGGFGVWHLTRVDDTTRPPEPSTITLSKETTFVLGPVDEFGYVDYPEAIDGAYRKGVTPENNAAIPFWRVFGPMRIPPSVRVEFFKRLGIPPLLEHGDYISLTDRTGLDFVEGKVIDRPWTTAEFPDLARWLQRNERPLRLLVEATKRPRFYSPLLAEHRLYGRQAAMSLLLEDCQTARLATRILLIRALWHIGEKRVKEARSDIRAGHRLARLVGQNPTTIGGLAAIAIDALIFNADFALAQSGRLTAEQFKECMAEAHQLTDVGNCVTRLDRCDRLIILDCGTLIARNGWDGIDLVGDLKSKRRVFERYAERQILKHADWNVILRFINRHFDRVVAIGNMEDREDRRVAIEAFKRDLAVLRSRSRGLPEITRDAVTQWFADWLVADLCPEFGEVWMAEDRNRLRTLIAEIAYALGAYRADAGQYPDKLQQLATTYLKVIPVDPLCGKPLVYSRVGNGYRLGSFGENGRDDNGRGFYDKPTGDDLFIKTP